MNRAPMAVYRKIFDHAVFNRMDSIFAPDILQFLHDELFIRQTPRADHAPSTALHPCERPFGPVEDLVPRSIAESCLDNEASWKPFAEQFAQIAGIRSLGQPVETAGQRQAVRTVVPEHVGLCQLVFQSPERQSPLVKSESQENLSQYQRPSRSRHLR